MADYRANRQRDPEPAKECNEQKRRPAHSPSIGCDPSQPLVLLDQLQRQVTFEPDKARMGTRAIVPSALPTRPLASPAATPRPD